MADPLHAVGPDLLPHSGPARLLTEIVRSGGDFVEAICEVPAVHPLASGGRAPCFLGLELGAQAAAVLEALDRATATGDHAPRVGYLVRVREATFLRPDFPVDTPLFVTARLERASPPLGTFRISVGVDGIEFLQATLVTYGRT